MPNTSDDEILQLSATRIAELIRSGEISSEEITRRYLERIERINPQIRAVVALADDAMDRARDADAALAAGKPLGALHGVPMTIKDCFDTAGVVSTWGTVGRKGFVPDADAAVVRRLKQAGAILLGKTNTPEFTLSFETYNKLHGFTNNPYALDHSPGGSSGGAAALIAASGTAFDIGTDYGGSIRVPSHCCGTVGIKPTSGSVARTGLCLPPGMLTDALSHAGPMARRVEDLALLLPVIWGPDGVDTRIADVAYPDPGAVDLRGLKCAVTTDNGISTPDADTIGVVEAAAGLMAGFGAEVTADRLPGAEQILGLDSGLWMAGGHRSVEQMLEAAGTARADYANNWFRELADSIDRSVPTDLVVDTLTRWEDFRREQLGFMTSYDVLISPVNARPAQPHGQPGDMAFPVEHATYTIVFDLTGWPSGALRGGTSSNGLPIGVQVTANPWRDDIVLAVMAALEGAFGPFPPPDLGAAAS